MKASTAMLGSVLGVVFRRSPETSKGTEPQLDHELR